MLHYLTASAFLLSVSGAHAAVFTYSYQGPDLICTDDSTDCTPGDVVGRYTADLILSEELLGRSLSNFDQTFIFEFGFPPILTGPTDAIVELSWDVGAAYDNDFFGTVVETQFDLKTNQRGEIIQGVVSITDGPPDGIIGSTTDALSFGDAFYVSTGPGAWTLVSVDGDLVPIPLPAGLALLFGGLIALGSTRGRQLF